MDSRAHSLSTNITHPNSALYRVPINHNISSISIPSSFPSMPSDNSDPSSVDVRPFYPYVPNEVKHRKRTTRNQQVVLEEVFRTNTKPNAALRKDLAIQLSMQARGVQVWFQNRRAKEKKKAEILGARKHASTPKPEIPISPVEDDDPEDDSLLSPTSAEPASESNLDSPVDFINTPKSANLESPIVILQSDPESSSSWPSSPSSLSPREDHAFPHQANYLNLCEDSLLRLRRGSEPVNMYTHSTPHSSYGPPTIDDIDPSARRRSIDLSVHRLATHPYAHLAMEKNGLYPPRFTPYPPGRQSTIPMSSRLPHPYRYRGSIPGGSGAHDLRHASASYAVDMPALRYPNMHTHTNTSSSCSLSPSPSPISPVIPDAPTAPMHPRNRVVPSTLPGPLPQPGFSFGAPAPLSCDTGSPDPSQDLVTIAYPRHMEETDEEDNVSYYTRFGSIASSFGSNTSAIYSDCPSAYESRRTSSASLGCLDMSRLDMGCQPTHGTLGESAAAHPYAQNSTVVSGIKAAALQARSNSIDGSSCYHSPSSTVSPGGSPHTQSQSNPHAQTQNQEPTSRAPFTISPSSELAFALHINEDKVTSGGGSGSNSHGNNSSSSLTNLQYATTAKEADLITATRPAPTQLQIPSSFYTEIPNMYQQAAATSSNGSLNLGMEFARQYDGDVISASGHYDPYGSPVEGYAEYNGHPHQHQHQQSAHLHHQQDQHPHPHNQQQQQQQMPYDHCALPPNSSSDMYANYSATALGTASSSLENGLHPVDSYVNYS